MDKNSADWTGVFFILGIVFLIFMFTGTPDIADAVREYIFSLAKKGQ